MFWEGNWGHLSPLRSNVNEVNMFPSCFAYVMFCCALSQPPPGAGLHVPLFPVALPSYPTHTPLSLVTGSNSGSGGGLTE